MSIIYPHSFSKTPTALVSSIVTVWLVPKLLEWSDFFGTPCRLFYIRLDLVRLVVRLDATAYGKSKFTGLFFHRSIHSTVLLPHVRF